MLFLVYYFMQNKLKGIELKIKSICFLSSQEYLENLRKIFVSNKKLEMLIDWSWHGDKPRV